MDVHVVCCCISWCIIAVLFNNRFGMHQGHYQQRRFDATCKRPCNVMLLCFERHKHSRWVFLCVWGYLCIVVVAQLQALYT